jgi:MFS family permease
VSWRWCFYINLPFGGLAMIMLMLFLPNDPAPKARSQESFWRKFEQFDPIGLLLLIPGLILVLLALQWGGNQYSWSSARVIATLVVGIVLLIMFGISQALIGEKSTLPPRIMCQRSIASASAASLGFGSALIVVSFYLPIWYQAIEQLSAIAAGVRMLAYFLVTVIFVIGSGFIVSKTGYYTPWLIGGTALMIVGCGLFSTLEVGTSTAHIIGYQVRPFTIFTERSLTVTRSSLVPAWAWLSLKPTSPRRPSSHLPICPSASP